MSIAQIKTPQIADWLLFRKSMNHSIVFFLGSRIGGLFKNKSFYNQIQSQRTLPFDTLNEVEKFYECYHTLSQLDSTDKYNTLTSSLKERPNNFLEHQYLAILAKEGYVDVIITTNIDSLLEEAMRREKVQETRDYQIFVYGKDSFSDIIHSPDNVCIILKVFGDLKNKEYKSAGNEFDLRADKNLRHYIESLLARHTLVIGYDDEWDCPLEWAFPTNGGDFVYVNIVPPTQDLLVTRALKSRNGSYLVESEQEEDTDFMRELYFELKRKISKANNIVDAQVPSQSNKTTRNRIFISYCHEDAVYMQRLKVFLQDYSRQGLIDDWDDTKIPVGSQWFEEINNALSMTKVAVLLLSADFFASNFINKYELPILLDRANAGEIKLVPVVLSPCDFHNTKLSSYQSANPPSKPLKKMSHIEQEEVWERVKILVKEYAS
jgi:hypothetical protein